MSHPGLRALVVDDTVVYRKILSDVVQEMPEVMSVQVAPQGRSALARLAQQDFEVVLLDVEMPDMDGLQTLAEIRRLHPETAVIMISGATTRSKDNTVRALEAGALDFLSKPDGPDPDSNRAQLRDRLRPLFRHLHTRILLKGAQNPEKESVAGSVKPASFQNPVQKPVTGTAGSLNTGPFEVLAIGVSTGGPNALSEVIPHLPGDLGIPVLLVQHMPRGFTGSLAQHLDARSALEVREATEGEPVQPNVVYIAPGGRHMTLRRFTAPDSSSPTLVVGLNDNPPENSCRPSVDVLFRSVAAQHDGKVLAVVMTGMGSDGLEGVRTLKRKGARVLTQSASTCVVYGMPMAVDEAGLSDESIPLPALASRITQILKRRSS